MSFSVGDKVSLIHSTEKGKILRFEGEIVIVETLDGFEIPVLAKELVSSEQNVKPKISFVAESDKKEKSLLPSNFYLALSRQDVRFACSILNKTNQEALVLFQIEKDEELQTIFAGKMAPNATLRKIALLEPSEHKLSVHLKAILYNDKSLEGGGMLSKLLKIKGRHLEGAQHVAELNDDALLFQLQKEEKLITPDLIEEAMQTKVEVPVVEKVEKRVLESRVIDLHLEALPEKSRFENNQDGLLEYQLAEFQREFDRAIAVGAEEITFIHGVGNGVLQSELQKIISKNDFVDTFKDAHKGRFGYGALKVFFKQS